MLHAARIRVSLLARSHRIRERIGTDGRLLHGHHTRGHSIQPARDEARPYVPTAPPISQAQLDLLAAAIQSSRTVTVLTGAGISTESNIPDYRGPLGAYSTGFTPMTHQQFMASEENRARYFARSFFGWPGFSKVQHNQGHEALAQLQRQGWIGNIITQNVDRLHSQAGAQNVLELHGTTHEVRCMSCGRISCRHVLQEKLCELNPGAAELSEHMRSTSLGYRAWQESLRVGKAEDTKSGISSAVEVPVRRPDGDMEIKDAGQNFQLPSCDGCGSALLKPDVVFFGDNIPKPRADRAMSLARESDLFIAIGTSLMVFSAFRLAEVAAERGKLVVLNLGVTRADGRLPHEKIEVVVGDALSRLAAHPALLLPRCRT